MYREARTHLIHDSGDVPDEGVAEHLETPGRVHGPDEQVGRLPSLDNAEGTPLRQLQTPGRVGSQSRCWLPQPH